jgi:TusA-related sulfurtransferase
VREQVYGSELHLLKLRLKLERDAIILAVGEECTQFFRAIKEALTVVREGEALEVLKDTHPERVLQTVAVHAEETLYTVVGAGIVVFDGILDKVRVLQKSEVGGPNMAAT